MATCSTSPHGSRPALLRLRTARGETRARHRKCLAAPGPPPGLHWALLPLGFAAPGAEPLRSTVLCGTVSPPALRRARLTSHSPVCLVWPIVALGEPIVQDSMHIALHANQAQAGLLAVTCTAATRIGACGLWTRTLALCFSSAPDACTLLYCTSCRCPAICRVQCLPTPPSPHHLSFSQTSSKLPARQTGISSTCPTRRRSLLDESHPTAHPPSRTRRHWGHPVSRK